MSCQYCDLNNYKNTDWDNRKILQLDWDCYTGLYMYYNPINNKFSIAAGGEGEVEIRYCPKCGRRLT